VKQKEKIVGKLISKSFVTSQINTFVFKLNQELLFIPGQYVFLEIKGFEIKRPFSILDYDKENETLYLGIKKHGEFTNKLWSLDLDSEVFITGPYGRFFSTNEKIVFIAGGIGITPIYNLAKNLDKNNKDCFLFYSSRSEEEMPYIKEITKLDINKTLFFTRKPSKKGLNCRISADYILKNIGAKEMYEFLICGPKDMIDSVRNQLVKAGISNDKIKSEVF